jgi:uncharacterized protein (DUF58 family)
VLTDRGRSLLALGGLTYLGAWAFGAQPLYPVAVGLVLAVAGAAVWVRVLRRPMSLRHSPVRGEHLAGDDVPVRIELDVQGRMPPASLVVRERIERVGEFEVPLRRTRNGLRASYVIESLSRGRYPVESSHVVIEDPFALERAEVELSRTDSLLVYPRLVEIDRLFTDTGGRTPGGRRLLLRRTAGYELHSVREYEQGESLRRVHWPSTARRGELMVKELEDAPRDETAVLLDADASTVVGSPPDSTFELQIRAAGSIVRAHARRGRRSSLIINSQARPYQRVHSLDADWQRAMELLAGIEPDGHAPVANVLADESGAASRAIELTVVTASLTARLVDRLLQRMLAHHGAAIVYVDPASFAVGEERRPDREGSGQLIRLQRAGIPTLVLRRGDNLVAKLEGEREAFDFQARAHA